MSIAILLAVIGLLLIYFEFFLPGGIMGVAGGVLLISSIVILLLNDPGSLVLIIFIASLIIALLITIKIALWRVRSTGKKGTIFLDSDQTGYFASFYDKELVGKLGIAESDLKPSGHVKIDDTSYQAVSKGRYINKGSTIQVIGGEGSRLIVKQIEEEV
ncbi:MAG: serine protease [Chlamydiae bacterium CG10_big_fil_rev_8_21_14_0_10_35_9]|nr:MAG: serine protease [Chlamydiae bacterium CG10_big_fil_rev_8_21_14_0_10_35_9]